MRCGCCPRASPRPSPGSCQSAARGTKPSPDPLLTACFQMGLWPNEVIYVGDALVDLVCAEAAGTHFIAYGDAIEGYEPVVCSFTELEQAVMAFE